MPGDALTTSDFSCSVCSRFRSYPCLHCNSTSHLAMSVCVGVASLWQQVSTRQGNQLVLEHSRSLFIKAPWFTARLGTFTKRMIPQVDKLKRAISRLSGLYTSCPAQACRGVCGFVGISQSNRVSAGSSCGCVHISAGCVQTSTGYLLTAEPWSSPTLGSLIPRFLSLSLCLRTTKTTPAIRKINPTPTPTPTAIPVIFALFVPCGCPVADVVATEAVVGALSEAMGAVVEAIEALVKATEAVIEAIEAVVEALESVVCPSVFVVLAPLTAPCNGKTTLCV